MDGYCLKLSLFAIFPLHIGIMTLQLCSCSADIFTSGYVPIEGQCYLKIYRCFFGVCARQLLLHTANCC
jgi:hypothetical protein